MSAHIKRRVVKSGIRYLVYYRLGGGRSKHYYAGSFKTPAKAEEHLQWIRYQIAAGTLRPERARPKRERPESVYFAQLGDLIKIGVSVAPETRARALNAELLHVEDGGREREDELHSAFAHLRVRGEWFRDDARIRRYLAKVAA